ncbi:MAG: PIN domain-containing protein [Candidatus Jacksonbacteria bacterium]
MTDKQIKPKLIFIDSSVYLNCALKQVEKLSLGTLEKILKKIESKKIILLLPEIIKNEVLLGIKNGFEEIQEKLNSLFDSIKNQIENPKESSPKKSKIIDTIISEAKKIVAEKVEKEYTSTIEFMKKILNHHNVKMIEMTDELILAGMRRSLLKKAPWAVKRVAHTKDQDCIVLESILEYIKNDKKLQKMNFVICTDDKDYFSEDTEDLKDDIKKDLAKRCDSVVGYKNPLIMLQKEFKEKYTKKQIKEYDNFVASAEPFSSSLSLLKSSEIPLSLDNMVSVAPISNPNLSVLSSFPVQAGLEINNANFPNCPNCGSILLYRNNVCHNCGINSMIFSDHIKI